MNNICKNSFKCSDYSSSLNAYTHTYHKQQHPTSFEKLLHERLEVEHANIWHKQEMEDQDIQ